jgi:hypothetical protein
VRVLLPLLYHPYRQTLTPTRIFVGAIASAPIRYVADAGNGTHPVNGRVLQGLRPCAMHTDASPCRTRKIAATKSTKSTESTPQDTLLL